jgi:predicted MFS family arabinose efflux permease
MALVSAVGVAVVYLPQPLQTLEAAEFGIDPRDSAWPQIVSQLGYAAGILFLLPASDRNSTRRQVSVQLIVTAVGLIAAAVAPTFLTLCVATAVVGAATTVAPVLIADTVRLAPPESRGRSAAVLGGAFLVGIFTARSLAGGLADVFGWRAVLAGSAVLVLACLPLVRLAADDHLALDTPRYGRVLLSIPALAVRTPALLLNTAVQICTFGAFVQMWGTFTLHAVTGTLGLTVLRAALIGLSGLAAGGVAIALAGAVDRVGTRRILLAAILLELAGLASLVVAPDSLPVTIPAMFAISLGAIVAQIATQARGLPAAGPGTAARANTVYMVSAFGAGALWVALGTAALALGGYGLAAVLGLALVTLALGLWAVGRRAGLV